MSIEADPRGLAAPRDAAASVDAGAQGTRGGQADAASPTGGDRTDASGSVGSDAGVAADALVDAPSPGRCVAGMYAGQFEGVIKLFGLSLFNITGEIAIEVEASMQGDSLRIENGVVDGADQDGNRVHAEVSGVLNCVTLELEDGLLLNGTYVRTALDTTVEFDGIVEATYSPGETPSVQGTWETDGGFESGEGSFRAELVPAAP